MASSSCLLASSSDGRRRRDSHLSFEIPSFSLGIDTESVRAASGYDCSESSLDDGDTLSGEKIANLRSAEDVDFCVGKKSAEQFLDDEFRVDAEPRQSDGHQERRSFKRLKRGPASHTARATTDDASPGCGTRGKSNSIGSRAAASTNGELPKRSPYTDLDQFLTPGRNGAAREDVALTSTPCLEKRSRLSLPKRSAAPSTPVVRTCSTFRNSQGDEDSRAGNLKGNSGVSKGEVSSSPRFGGNGKPRSPSLQHIPASSENDVDDIEDFSDDECANGGLTRSSKFLRSPNLASIPLNSSSSQKPSLHISKANVQSKLQSSPLRKFRIEGPEHSIGEDDVFSTDAFVIRSNQWGVARQNSKNRVQDSRPLRQEAAANPSTIDSRPGPSSLPVRDFLQRTAEANGASSTVRQGNAAEEIACELDPFSREDSHCNSDGWRKTRQVYPAPDESRLSSRHHMREASPIIISSSPEELHTPTLHIPGASGEMRKQGSSFPSTSEHTIGGSSFREGDFPLDDFEQDSSGWRSTRHDLGGRRQNYQQATPSNSYSARSGSVPGVSKARQPHSNPTSVNWWKDPVSISSQTSQRTSVSGSGGRTDPQNRSKPSGSQRENNLRSFLTKTPVRSDTVGPSQDLRADRESEQDKQDMVKEYLRRRLPHYKSVDALLVDGGLNNEPVFIDYKNQFADEQSNPSQSYSEPAGNSRHWSAGGSTGGAFSSSTPRTNFANKRNASSQMGAARRPKARQKSNKGESSTGGRANPTKKADGGGRWTTINGTKVYVVGGNQMSGRGAYVTYRKGRGGFPSKKKETKRPVTKRPVSKRK